jgi:hypothetical protein
MEQLVQREEKSWQERVAKRRRVKRRLVAKRGELKGEWSLVEVSLWKQQAPNFFLSRPKLMKKLVLKLTFFYRTNQHCPPPKQMLHFPFLLLSLVQNLQKFTSRNVMQCFHTSLSHFVYVLW